MEDITDDFRQRGFLPPQYVIYRLPARASAAAWRKIPPIPGFIDLAGRRLQCNAPDIRLAWSHGVLWLRLQWPAVKISERPEIPAAHPDFWRQDHIEFRCLLPGSETDCFRILLTPSGRFFANRGHAERKIRMIKSHCGSVIVTIPLGLLGRSKNPQGSCVRGIVALVRWQGEIYRLACNSACELGFGQRERFAEFLFASTPPHWHFAMRENSLVLCNHNRSARRAMLRVAAESGNGAGNRTLLATEHLFPPGETILPLRLPLTADSFCRYAVSLEEGKQSLFLGSFVLRGSIQRLRLRPSLAHPYLMFTAEDLLCLRAKARHQPWRALAERLHTEISMIKRDASRLLAAAASLDFTPNSANWFRVAKETMLGLGETGHNAAAARLWRLQSKEAHAAWREVVKTVTPSQDALTVLLAELNSLLRRRDLYDPQAFAHVRLPAEAREMLRRGLQRLPEKALVRFNRLLLQSAVECIHNNGMELLVIPRKMWEWWLATGDKDAPALATAAVASARQGVMLGHEIHLHEGMAASHLALAYDSFAPLLSRDERLPWQQMLRRFLDLYLETVERGSWTVTTIANANPVVNGGCGLAALAVCREMPQIARRALAHARANIRRWLDYCNGPYGGNTEGAQYWQYGMENFLRFALALERTTGSDDGLLSHPAVKNAINMIRVGLSNDGALHGVNDTIPMPIGGNFAWFAAGRWGDTFGLWYGDHAWRWLERRRRQGKPAVYGCRLSEALLYRPAVPLATKATPRLPTAICLPDIQYATVRSAPRWYAAWVAGLKGSRPPYTHHNQPDTASLWLDVHGERLLIDPGYYKGKPEHHCIPLIGGAGPRTPDDWTGRIIACASHGHIRYVACDATKAYEYAQRVRRHVLLVAEEALLVIDDIVADKPTTLLFQCGAPTASIGEKAGKASWLIKGRKTHLAVACFAKGRLQVTLAAERSLHDVHWGYHFADCRWFPVRVAHRGVGPIVTIISEQRTSAAWGVRFHDDTIHILARGQRCFVLAPGASGWEWLGEQQGGR